MFSAIRKRMTYANVAMTLALVFAMTGGALAASHKGKHAQRHKKSGVTITSTKQISKSVLAALKGNTGPAGPQGPAGAAGTAGPKGTAGPEGKAGKDGTNGSNGTDGKSVVAAAEAPGGYCAEGGTSLEVEGSGVKHYACNGKDGASVKMTELPPESAACPAGGEEFTVGAERGTACNGQAGSGGSSRQLKSGETEEGLWGVDVGTKAGETYVGIMSISFPIPLTVEQREHITVHYLKNGEESTEGCEKNAANPAEGVRAEPGNLCVVSGGSILEEGTSASFSPTLYYRVGDQGYFFNSAHNATLTGTWALTVK